VANQECYKPLANQAIIVEIRGGKTKMIEISVFSAISGYL
jgi:hypothetical protein